jgi:hypothetical protein
LSSKSKKQENRLDQNEIITRFDNLIECDECLVVMERPMKGRGRVTSDAVFSSGRSFESWLLLLSTYNKIKDINIIDAKLWQNVFIKDYKDKKLGSTIVSNKIFPQFTDIKPKHPDRDALLIALYHFYNLKF